MQNLMKTNNLTMISKWFPSKHGGIGGMKEVLYNSLLVYLVIAVLIHTLTWFIIIKCIVAMACLSNIRVVCLIS